MSFSSYVSNKLNQGRRHFITNAKYLIYKEDQQLFDWLDFDDDECFTEPLIYAYFNSAKKEISLRQILWGYIANDKRPPEITVYCDMWGIVYLPKTGYYKLSCTDSIVKLRFSKGNISFFDSDEQCVQSQFIPLIYINGTNIEVYQHSNLLLNEIFALSDKESTSLNIKQTLNRKLDVLNAAFAILKNNFPEGYAWINQVARNCFVFQSPHKRSFATMKANGAAFLNIKDDHDEVSVLEDITHQFGHVVYYAVLWDKKSYLNAAMDTPMQTFTKKPSESRQLLSALYAMLPYCLSNTCSKNCFENHVFHGAQLTEFIGRYAFRMSKFSIDIKNFNTKGIFTAKGKILNKQFNDVFNEINNIHGRFLFQLDVANQDYEFDFERFLLANPDFELQPVL